MVDVVSVETRSRMMSGIRAKNTRPEMRLRRFLHKAGFRYRLHDRSLPGTPDLVFPRFRTVILVHGCFWHRHVNCRLATTPGTNVEFWQRKFASNVERDCLAVGKLLAAGWKVIVIWECGLKSVGAENRLEWLPGHITDGLQQYLEWPVSESFLAGKEGG
ncbi:Very short patch repair endonuclease [Cupriavidus necator]|uniref:very short patch repair endonuclease n=1 Tax=Cupriavidus necator TaxID=106590 RepID=UPI003F733515